MPEPSTLIKWGWKSASGASNRSPPTLMTRPSGSFFFSKKFVSNIRWLLILEWPHLRNLLCKIRRAPSSRAPAFVPFQCCSRCSRVSLSIGGQFRNRPCDWTRSLSTATAAQQNHFKISISRMIRIAIAFYLDQISSDISAGNVEPSRQMGHSESFVDWTNVCDTVTGIDHHASQKALCVQGKYGLNGDVRTSESIFFKHHLSNFKSLKDDKMLYGIKKPSDFRKTNFDHFFTVL